MTKLKRFGALKNNNWLSSFTEVFDYLVIWNMENIRFILVSTIFLNINKHGIHSTGTIIFIGGVYRTAEYKWEGGGSNSCTIVISVEIIVILTRLSIRSYIFTFGCKSYDKDSPMKLPYGDVSRITIKYDVVLSNSFCRTKWIITKYRILVTLNIPMLC